ncbi:hypothetical protein ACEOS4_004836 [Escherichia coli]
MLKLLGVCGLFLLAGCSTLYSSLESNVKDKPELLSYRLYANLVSEGCFQKGFSEKDELIRDDNRYRYFFNETQFRDPVRCIDKTKQIVSELCASLNGVMQNNWCDSRDNYPLFLFQQDSEPYDNGRVDFEFDEAINGRENDWKKYAISSGFVDHEYETNRKKEEEIQRRKENEFNQLVKGEPQSVMQAAIGTRICKVDTYRTRSYSSPLVLYTGFIENKTKQKIQIRFESHVVNDSLSGYYDFNDVSNLITWATPDGWFMCEK